LGSTYIRDQGRRRELPPFLFAGLRFFAAGCWLLAIAARWRSPAAPRRATGELSRCRAVPAAGGNAFVVWAEQYTPSGSRASSSSPVAIWTAFFDAIIRWVGEMNWRVVAGLLLASSGRPCSWAEPRRISQGRLRGPLALTVRDALVVDRLRVRKRHPTGVIPTSPPSIR